jgi:hypothetical protein
MSSFIHLFRERYFCGFVFFNIENVPSLSLQNNDEIDF